MRKRNRLPKDLLRVENRLKQALRPVQPPAAFVEELQGRLDQAMIRKHKTKKVQTGLLVAGGLVSLAVMVISLIRSLTSWPSTIRSLTKNLPKVRKGQQPASV